MPAPELRHHLMTCPDRVMVSQDITAGQFPPWQKKLALLFFSLKNIRAIAITLLLWAAYLTRLKEHSREVLAQQSADFTQGPLMSSCEHF